MLALPARRAPSAGVRAPTTAAPARAASRAGARGGVGDRRRRDRHDRAAAVRTSPAGRNCASRASENPCSASAAASRQHASAYVCLQYGPTGQVQLGVHVLDHVPRPRRVVDLGAVHLGADGVVLEDQATDATVARVVLAAMCA